MEGSGLRNRLVDDSSTHSDSALNQTIGNPLASPVGEGSHLVRVASNDNSSNAWHPSVSGRQSNAASTFWVSDSALI